MKAELFEIFDLFDQNGTGRVSYRDLGRIMRGLGRNPTEADLINMINEGKDLGNSSFDFTTFLNLMQRNLQDTDTEEELRERCKVYDREKNGLISLADLRWVLLNLGEKLTEEEVEEMLTEAEEYRDNGYFIYHEFIRMMFIT